MNSGLREGTLRLNMTSNFAESVLSDVQIGVTVLPPAPEVRLQNRHAEEMWGL
jgi:nitrogen fixation/metabolism regulation signal transduction histidine kinase